MHKRQNAVICTSLRATKKSITYQRLGLPRVADRFPSTGAVLIGKLIVACFAGADVTRSSAYPRAASAQIELFTKSKVNTMNRRTTLVMTTTSLFCFAVGLSSSPSFAQQQSLKGQLIGTWALVSSDQVRPDGSRLKQFGADPKGINVFDANGRFFIMIARADNSQIASNDPRSTKAEESGALIVESIAYYGTYTVNETEHFIMLHLEASTFPNQIGTDQKRTVTSLTANELRYSAPAAIPGTQIHQVWKRAE